MNAAIEIKLLEEIAELKRKVYILEGGDNEQRPSYQYSKIRDSDLQHLFAIERNLDTTIFIDWLDADIELDAKTSVFLKELLADNAVLMDSYGEEDLKIHVIAPILNAIHFKSLTQKIRDFYELHIRYATSEFILNGTADFVVSAGLVTAKKPYFFIQEFKRSEEYGNPRPQLLAELISAVELNNWTIIKGAYVIGSLWHFVILEKLPQLELQLELGASVEMGLNKEQKHQKYQYYISRNFDATKLVDLQDIYKNLLYVKREILTMARAVISS